MTREGLLYKIAYRTTAFDALHSLVLVVVDQDRAHYFRLCQNIKPREADTAEIESGCRRGNIWSFESLVVPELQNRPYTFNVSNKTF